MQKYKKVSIGDLDELLQKLNEIDSQVSKGQLKIGRSKKADVDQLRSMVAQELFRKQQLQSHSLCAHKVTPRTPGFSGKGVSVEEREGYESEPGSSGSQVAPLHQVVEQPSNAALASRLDCLEQRYMLKVESLESTCSSLKKTVKDLESKLAQKDSHIQALEATVRTLEANQTALESSVVRIRVLEEAFAKQEETNRKCERKINELKDKLDQRGSASASQPSTSSGTTSRDFVQLESQIKTLESQLKASISNIEDRLSSGGLQTPTPWQEWKTEACQLIGTSNPNEKAPVTLKCFDTNCPWQNKVTLNGYIQHLKRKPHLIRINTNPDQQYLPRL